jgi:hypothetical protein
MSYNPKKGMHKNAAGVAVFDEPGTAPEGGAGKSWWNGTVTRRVVNSKGETVRRSKQSATLFAKEGDVPALLCRQCPDTPQASEGDVRTSVSYSRA